MSWLDSRELPHACEWGCPLCLLVGTWTSLCSWRFQSLCVSRVFFFFYGARYPRFSKKIRVEEEKSSVVREMKFIKVRDKDWRTAKWKNVKMKMNMGEWIHSRLWIILCCYYYTSTHTWNYFYYLSISTTPRKRFVVYTCMEKSLSFIFWLFFDYFLIIFIFFVINI
jgi:hypothetical protein